ncbi:MAG: ribulose bisphosphate carboxylase small subunit [Thiotrichales bacterium]|nr:MAG: ribulose bisphosphate carboxylase small subunit [Thiotrichales bacterium]
MFPNPTQVSRLELPSVAKVKKLVEDSLGHDWMLRIEHVGSVPGKTVRAQWQQWGDSMFAVTDASSVIDGIVACRASYPRHAIRLNAEKVNPRTQMYHRVFRPERQGNEARIQHHAGAVSSRINERLSSLVDAGRSLRGAAW